MTAKDLQANNQKRLAILQKSLEKKKKAIKVQEELFASEPDRNYEDHKTYKYYQEQLEHAEREYEKKCKYFNDAIDALKEKLRSDKPTGKVYRRLVAEVEMEQREYDELSKQSMEINKAVSKMEADRVKYEMESKMREEKRKENEKRQRDLELLQQQRAMEKAKDEERWKKQWEKEKEEAKEAEKKIPHPPRGGSFLERIKASKSMDELGAIEDERKAMKVEYTAEEDALWTKRADELEAEQDAEIAKMNEEKNSIVSDPAVEYDEKKVQRYVEASKIGDLETQNSIELSQQEWKEAMKLFQEYCISKPKVSFSLPSMPAPQSSAPRILMTTKKVMLGKMTEREKREKGLL